MSLGDDQDEMNKFLQQLELEKNVGKHIVFIQSNIKLNSAIAFSQYAYETVRLITMIGELHTQKWTCLGWNMSVVDYCIGSVQRNPKCKIMLEYNSNDDPTRIGSDAIKETYAGLERIGKLDAIIPFDFRSFFLTPIGQGRLYDRKIDHMQWEEIGKQFVEPFYARARENPHLFDLQGQYKPSIRSFMEKNYLPDIDSGFRYITSMFGIWSKKEVQSALKDAWKKVADYFILREVLRHDVLDEYIIVLGKAHYENLSTILSNAAQELVRQIGNPKECVNLYQTYRFS